MGPHAFEKMHEAASDGNFRAADHRQKPVCAFPFPAIVVPIHALRFQRMAWKSESMFAKHESRFE
jgi:hypothetical protein